MNDGSTAREIKSALERVERDPHLPAAVLRVVDKWFVFKRAPQSGGDINHG
jgi:hypothetical protein